MMSRLQSALDAESPNSDASDVDDEAADSGLPPEPIEACSGALISALPWFEDSPTGELMGSLEFAQTHVVRADETRLAPPVTAERESLLLFTPDAPLPESSDLRVAALAYGEVLGCCRCVLQVNSQRS